MTTQQRIPQAEEHFRTPPRPSRYDDEICRAAARVMAPKFFEYCGEANPPEREFEHMVEQLAGALSHTMSCDGFELAYELKRTYCWEGDEQLVELCSELGWEVGRQADVAVRQWIIDNNVEPPLAVGTPVLYLDAHGGSGWCGAEITRSIAETGEFTVFVESLGHVREGIGTHGFVVPWESDKIKPKETPCP